MSALASGDLLQIGLSVAVLIASLSFHEAAHAWAADRLGDPTARMLGRLSLNPLVHIDPVGTVLFPLLAIATGLPLIGWARPVPVNPARLASPRRDFAIVAAAGPASNLVLAVVAGFAFRTLEQVVGFGGSFSQPTDVLAYAAYFAVVINVLLAVFNLIPVPPLDGGNILAGIVPAPVAGLIDRLRPYGFILLYGLMLSGALTRVILPVQRVLRGWLL
ncbi:MAG: site-2 protease family protein [Vicinamibacterales bacterium]